MKENKICATEVENLREYAEKERQTRRRMLDYVELAKRNKLSEEGQIELIKRGKKSEILALLQAYAGDDAKEKMSGAAQLYLYEKGDVEDNEDVYRFLLKKVPYTDELTKRLIDDKNFCLPLEGHYALREISPEMQCYFLEHRLIHEMRREEFANNYIFTESEIMEQYFNFMVLESIERYFNKYDLCEKAEIYLLKKCLNPEPSLDSFMDGCYNLVKEYVTCKKKLSLAGEKILIASGKHNLILRYIQIAEGGLKAEDELLARGNREEVTAYFKRYATL